MDLCGNLPRDVAINILSRLPIRSIIECKAVSRAWRDLVKCREFSNRHEHRHLVCFPYTSVFPTSNPNLSPKRYGIEEFNHGSTSMSIVYMGLVESVPLVRCSVDGLILLLRREWEEERQRVVLWVCNPITREYVHIPNPSEGDFVLGLPYPPETRANFIGPPIPESFSEVAPPIEYGNYNFGFGVSRSEQYKVVWISQFECRVYTLGTTGEWRTIPIPGALRYNKWNPESQLMEGNLYWLDPPEIQAGAHISCFDLENEAFTYFSAPLTRGDLDHECHRSLCRLDGRLCVCDVYVRDIEIWLMRGRGDWTRKLVIDGGVRRCRNLGLVFPIKVLEDDNNGNVKMLLGVRCYNTIYYYSKNSNGEMMFRLLYPRMTSRMIHDYPSAALYIPSFLPLKTLLNDGEENVRSF